MEISERDKKIIAENTKLSNDIEEVLRTDAGRRLVWHIIHNLCTVNHDIVGDSEYVQRKLGKRSIGLAIMSDIDFAGEDLYLKMALFISDENKGEGHERD